MTTREEYLKQLRDEETIALEKNSILIEKFTSFITNQNILPEIKYHYERPIGIVAEYCNIISELTTEIEQDKEGLFSWRDLQSFFERKRFMSGFLTNDKYMIMAHEYFRRGYIKSNNYAPSFIDMFWGLNDENIDAYIALDINRVRINVDNSFYMERDRWFGADFNNDIKQINDGILKFRPPANLDKTMIEMFFSSLYALDIMWYTTTDNIKVFQAEEFKVDTLLIEENGVEYHPVRYIHAEYDIENNHFRHFDGAIELYTSDEYFLRRDKNFNHKAKGIEQIKPHSLKLFKLNGKISVDLWIEFISHFLSGNPLVMEYFSGEYPQHIKEALAKLDSL